MATRNAHKEMEMEKGPATLEHEACVKRHLRYLQNAKNDLLPQPSLHASKERQYDLHLSHD